MRSHSALWSRWIPPSVLGLSNLSAEETASWLCDNALSPGWYGPPTDAFAVLDRVASSAAERAGLPSTKNALREAVERSEAFEERVALEAWDEMLAAGVLPEAWADAPFELGPRGVGPTTLNEAAGLAWEPEKTQIAFSLARELASVLAPFGVPEVRTLSLQTVERDSPTWFSPNFFPGLEEALESIRVGDYPETSRRFQDANAAFVKGFSARTEKTVWFRRRFMQVAAAQLFAPDALASGFGAILGILALGRRVFVSNKGHWIIASPEPRQRWCKRCWHATFRPIFGSRRPDTDDLMLARIGTVRFDLCPLCRGRLSTLGEYPKPDPKRFSYQPGGFVRGEPYDTVYTRPGSTASENIEGMVFPVVGWRGLTRGNRVFFTVGDELWTGLQSLGSSRIREARRVPENKEIEFRSTELWRVAP